MQSDKKRLRKDKEYLNKRNKDNLRKLNNAHLNLKSTVYQSLLTKTSKNKKYLITLIKIHKILRKKYFKLPLNNKPILIFQLPISPNK